MLKNSGFASGSCQTVWQIQAYEQGTKLCYKSYFLTYCDVRCPDITILVDWVYKIQVTYILASMFVTLI